MSTILQTLTTVPDEELLRHLGELLRDSRRTETDLVAHIGEVDTRRLYTREASPSMFAYCTERLHLSGAEAYLRIAAARASRQHPAILAMLADGRLHLTAIALIAPHLTPGNSGALLERATHRTKRQIEELLAEVAPRPDVPATVRKLPEPRPRSTALASCGPVPSDGTLPLDQRGGPGTGARLRPDGVATDVEETPRSVLLDPLEATPGQPAPTRSRPVVVEPLSHGRYRVEFTASAGLRDKLDRLRELMRSSAPDGDLATVIEAAVTEKLERLEARRFGRTKNPRPSAPEAGLASSSRHVPAAVRRAVHARDQGRCCYVDDQGRRCTARSGLEFHHRHPFGVGGAHSVGNVGLLCHAHNREMAEVDYGRERVAARGARSGDRPAGVTAGARSGDQWAGVTAGGPIR